MYNNNLNRKKVQEGGRLTKFSSGKPKLGYNTQLQGSWVWNNKVTELVKKYVKGYSLNCPAGLSDIGDVRGDGEPKSENVQLMDMASLPFPDNTFDTVISDPPWKINFFKRMKPFFEAVRVCKIGGTIIYNCTWRPTSQSVALKDVIVRTDAPWAMISCIWIFEKIADVPKKSGATKSLRDASNSSFTDSAESQIPKGTS